MLLIYIIISPIKKSFLFLSCKIRFSNKKDFFKKMHIFCSKLDYFFT